MNRHLVFHVGDVSGKGIPASLFMAVTITLLRARKNPDLPPHEILLQVNKELCRNNENTMFVTMFLGILDTNTGKLNYANAGHNPPLLQHENRQTAFVETCGGIPLGMFDDALYDTGFLMLKKGDTLLLYTDGVTEARNSQGDFYTDAALLNSFQQVAGLSAQDMAERLLADVRHFTFGASQSDDITLLTLNYRGPSSK